MSSDGIDSKQLLTSDGKTMENEDASKVVKTVKSFRELKALYEAKSTVPADPVPAKPSSIAKRFPAAVSSSNSPALPANRLTSSGSTPTKPAWKKNDSRSGSISSSTLPPVAEDCSTSTGAPVGGGSALTRSDQSPESSPLGSFARRSEAAKVAASPSSPRTWGRQSSGKVVTTANATGTNSAVCSGANNGFATVASDGTLHDAPSNTDSTTGAGTRLKRLNVEKVQVERDANQITPDSGRGRGPSITIEKGKVASVKEKFLGAEATAGANKFKPLGTTDQPSHISERGRAISGELRDGRGMESPRVSELIRGLTRSQEQEQSPANGGPFRGGSGTMTKSHNGIKEHNRSHSDTTSDLSVLPTKDRSTSSEPAPSVDGQGRPKPATNSDEGPLPTWAIRWQQRLQEKEKERERDKERLAEAIRSRSGTEDQLLETSAEQASVEVESTKADTKQTNESNGKHEQETPTKADHHVTQEVALKQEGSLLADRAKPADVANEQTSLVESPANDQTASVPASEEESSSGRTAAKSTTDAPTRTSGVHDQHFLELIGEEEANRAINSPPTSPLIRTRKPDPRRLSRTERLSSSPDKERRGSVIERSVTRSSSVDESDPLSQRNHGSAIGISTRRSTIGSSTPPSTGTLRRHSKDSTSSSANNSSPSSSPKPSRDDKADTPKRRAETTSSSSAKRRDGEASSERDRSERDKDRDKETDREKRDKDRGDKDREREKDRQRERDRDREKDREKDPKERERDRSDKEREKEPKERERDKEKDRAKDRPKRDESSASREDKSAATAGEKKDNKNEPRSSTIERRSRNRKDEPSSSSSASSSQSASESSKRKDRSGTLSQPDAKRSEAGPQETSNPASSPHRERRKESRADKSSGSDSPHPARNSLPPDSPHSSSRTEVSPRTSEKDSVLASPKRTEESRGIEEKKNKSVKPLSISNDGIKSIGSSPTVGSRTPRSNTPRARSERSKDSEESDRDKDKDRKDEKKEREREKDRSERDKEKDKERERDKEKKHRDERGLRERNRDREKDDKEKLRNDDKDRAKDKDRRDRKDRKSKDPYSSGEVDTRVERKEREHRDNSEQSRDKEKRDGRSRERGKDKERQEERDNDTKKEEPVVAEKEESVEAEGELKDGEATGEIAAVIVASDSDSDDTSIRGEIVDVSDDEESSRSDIDEVKRAGIALTIDTAPEPAPTVVKDEADMKQCFVDFMNQYYENKSSTENNPKSTLTRTKPNNSGSEVRRRSRTATREKIVLEAFPRYNHRDSLGTRSEIEDSLTETDVTAMSECMAHPFYFCSMHNLNHSHSQSNRKLNTAPKPKGK